MPGILSLPCVPGLSYKCWKVFRQVSYAHCTSSYKCVKGCHMMISKSILESKGECLSHHMGVIELKPIILLWRCVIQLQVLWVGYSMI